MKPRPRCPGAPAREISARLAREINRSLLYNAHMHMHTCTCTHIHMRYTCARILFVCHTCVSIVYECLTGACPRSASAAAARLSAARTASLMACAVPSTHRPCTMCVGEVHMHAACVWHMCVHGSCTAYTDHIPPPGRDRVHSIPPGVSARGRRGQHIVYVYMYGICMCMVHACLQ